MNCSWPHKSTLIEPHQCNRSAVMKTSSSVKISERCINRPLFSGAMWFLEIFWECDVTRVVGKKTKGETSDPWRSLKTRLRNAVPCLCFSQHAVDYSGYERWVCKSIEHVFAVAFLMGMTIFFRHPLRLLNTKLREISQTAIHKIIKDKQIYWKVFFNSFFLSGHTIGFNPQKQKLEARCITQREDEFDWHIPGRNDGNSCWKFSKASWEEAFSSSA